MKKESCPAGRNTGTDSSDSNRAPQDPGGASGAQPETATPTHTNERSRLKKLSTRTQKARGQRSEAGATARAGAQVATTSRERQGLGGRDWSARASVFQG
ncbi:hypothetical protein CEP54_008694 [Fusarium duplospermum]|uniref:Uncharacterized protein n=1 Tax=Fusarium duplospermum TaxID=1325734 RepID=A0A428PUJ1_9HYPO|nr:hypothetical protein CEP54_008694 [Fusarium duplospermum]